MRFSIIMPSRLANYNGAARYRDQKIIRAIKSVLDQSFQDFELIVIADGCNETKTIVTNEFTGERLKLVEVKHRALFDNSPRNKGISEAQGEYIVYLDNDDYWGEDHLAIINHNLNGYNWIWYNDYIWDGQWIERACNVRQMGACGTSNICHNKELNLYWERPGYAHDYHFVQKLLRIPNHTKIETPEYFVMHIPGKYDL